MYKRQEIYSAGETPMEGISAKLIVEAIEKHEQRPVTYLPTLEEVVDYLQDFIRPEDLVLTMGAGNVWSAGVLLVEKLRAEGE